MAEPKFIWHHTETVPPIVTKVGQSDNVIFRFGRFSVWIPLLLITVLRDPNQSSVDLLGEIEKIIDKHAVCMPD